MSAVIERIYVESQAPFPKYATDDFIGRVLYDKHGNPIPARVSIWHTETDSVEVMEVVDSGPGWIDVKRVPHFEVSDGSAA